MTGLNYFPMSYSIQGCPIQFHDLVEIFDFLQHLSPVLLYQYDGLCILLNDVPIMNIIVYYLDDMYHISYICIR